MKEHQGGKGQRNKCKCFRLEAETPIHQSENDTKLQGKGGPIVTWYNGDWYKEPSWRKVDKKKREVVVTGKKTPRASRVGGGGREKDYRRLQGQDCELEGDKLFFHC